jgi:hypothetical protein
MAADDMRYYETFYGIHTDDWVETFGVFADHHKLLVKEYINEGCSATETSTASDTNKFLYPQHIKKTYFIEGVIQGHITVAASTCTGTMTSYRVTVCKMNENTDDDELFTTGWVTVNDTLAWDAAYSIGDEMVYPFWIDAWNAKKLDEHERIYIKVETNSDNCCVLWHSNDSTWEDLKITIPFRL